MNDLHSQAQLYVLGALLSEEMREFEAHLATCTDCADEVAALREVTAHMSEAVATDPPPGLRARVLADVASTPQADADAAPEPGTGQVSAPQADAGPPRHLSPVAPVAADDAPQAAEPAAAESAPGDQTVVPMRRSKGSRASSIVAAAAVLAAVVAGGWAIQANRAADENQEQADVASAQAEQLTQLLGASDVQSVYGTFTNGNGGGRVVMSERQGMAMLVGSNLAELPEGKVYEAWTIDDKPAPAGTFESGAQSLVALPESTFDAKSVAVTVEPEGGSEQPTTDAVFTVSMPQN